MISVILPVYNAEKYIDECIESILAQTFSDIELVIVDDGSTDGTSEICRRYAANDKRVRLTTQSNAGQAAARNTGIDAAKGEFIAFVDADDIVHPQMLERLHRAIESSGAYISQCTWISGEKHVFTTETTAADIEIFSGKEACLSLLYQKTVQAPVWAKLYRTGVFNTIRFRPQLWYEDLDLIFRCMFSYARSNASKAICCIDEPLYFYRKTPGSFINTFNRRRLDVLRVTADAEKCCVNDTELLAAARDRRFSANYNMFVLTSRAGMRDDADVCWQLIKSYRTKELSDPNVRLKNKAGALLSYLGRRITLLVSHFIY